MRPTRIAIFLMLPGFMLHADLCRAEPRVPAEPQLGRLFLTPEWRSALDRQRQFNVQQTRAIEGDSLRLDGVVLRSSGKSTVWINQRPQTENTHDSGIVAETSQRRPGQVTVVTGGAAPTDLKVGTTFNQATGEKRGGLAAGEIRVRPAREK